MADLGRADYFCSVKSIAVFCGSNPGKKPVFMETAYELGRILAGKGIRVIYGGARVGLMGAVANGALAAGGEVIGVIPDFLREKELAHDELTELVVVEDMHTRKMKMHELSDGLIALPGGFGTLEELFEMVTWAQLGLHEKPMGVLNIEGYYSALKELADGLRDNGFVVPEHRAMLLVNEDISGLLESMEAYKAPRLEKFWEDPDSGQSIGLEQT